MGGENKIEGEGEEKKVEGRRGEGSGWERSRTGKRGREGEEKGEGEEQRK
jgi:hypothetical protein